MYVIPRRREAANPESTYKHEVRFWIPDTALSGRSGMTLP